MNRIGYFVVMPAHQLRFWSLVATLILSWTAIALQQLHAQTTSSPHNPPARPFVLNPPSSEGPVVVDTQFDLRDIRGVDDETETFEFTGVLLLKWRDPRSAFDPAVAGVSEKFFQGGYQFDEISPSWYPEVVLVNNAGSYEIHGTVLRVRPDGTTILFQKISASAKTRLNLRRYPFDSQELQAVFSVLGYENREVVLRAETMAENISDDRIWLPEWTVLGFSSRIEQRSMNSGYSNQLGTVFIFNVDVERRSFYTSRLITLPLVIIVLLSFSVFWMDRSSLGDRLNVSFIGVLTAVTYQLVMYDNLPRVSYITWMNAFLNISFMFMAATVVLNLISGVYDNQDKSHKADRLDHVCRRAFPVLYFAFILAASAIAFFVF